MDNSFLKIDELALDKECQDQPTLYLKYATKTADARLLYDEAQAELNLVSAQVAKHVREAPKSYGLSDKPTETAIKEAVASSRDVRDAEKAVREARHDFDVLTSTVIALEHRKRALTLMVELRRQDYFSTPSVSREGVKVVQEEAKKSTRSMGRKRED